MLFRLDPDAKSPTLIGDALYVVDRHGLAAVDLSPWSGTAEELTRFVRCRVPWVLDEGGLVERRSVCDTP